MTSGALEGMCSEKLGMVREGRHYQTERVSWLRVRMNCAWTANLWYNVG